VVTKPTPSEIERIKIGIQVAFAVPFIDDIEDFIWEAIFSYAKNIPLVDPLTNIRKKHLFDVVDLKTSIGWSAKACQWSISPGCAFELVIQRADIFKKGEALGFENLSVDSPTEVLGEALLKHWTLKIESDESAQNVKEKRTCILLKSKDRRKYAFIEDALHEYSADELEWFWTDENRVGLQGVRKSDGFCTYRWYPNQKQLFERFTLPDEALIFELEPKRLPIDYIVKELIKQLKAF